MTEREGGKKEGCEAATQRPATGRGPGQRIGGLPAAGHEPQPVLRVQAPLSDPRGGFSSLMKKGQNLLNKTVFRSRIFFLLPPLSLLCATLAFHLCADSELRKRHRKLDPGELAVSGDWSQPGLRYGRDFAIESRVPRPSLRLSFEASDTYQLTFYYVLEGKESAEVQLSGERVGQLTPNPGWGLTSVETPFVQAGSPLEVSFKPTLNGRLLLRRVDYRNHVLNIGSLLLVKIDQGTRENKSLVKSGAILTGLLAVWALIALLFKRRGWKENSSGIVLLPIGVLSLAIVIVQLMSPYAVHVQPGVLSGLMFGVVALSTAYFLTPRLTKQEMLTRLRLFERDVAKESDLAPQSLNTKKVLFNGCLKSFILFAIASVITLPINDPFDYFIILISGFIIVFGKIKTRCWRYFVVFVLIIISISAQALFPKAALQEGHNVFIFKQDGEPLERLLPKRVYRFLKGQFLEQYPPSAWCKSISTGCWRAYKVPDELFAFSADSIFQSAKYSRIVDTIDFSNVSAFRGGFVNDSRYPWYDNASDIQRGTMPFFVMYELSPQSVGSSLCWQGDVLWETTPAAFRHLQHDWEKCRDITESDVGKRIFGISVKKRTPLAIRLILSEPLMLSMIIKKWFRVLMAAAILALTVKFSLRRILVPGVISLLGLGTIAQETRGRLIAEYTPLLGGGDGLGYETLGRQGLISALKGDLLEVLRGGENIFHQMPGLRYFRAFEKFVFGDTNLGYLTVLMVLPIFIYYVFRKFISFRWALLFTLLFMGPWILKKTLDSGQVFGDFYFRYQTFIAWAEAGLAEPFAWIAFLGSIYFILSGINGEKGNY